MIFFKNLMHLIGERNRAKLIWLQAVFLMAAVAQVLSVAAIPPFIQMLTDPSIISTNSLFSSAYDFIGAKSDREFLIFYAGGVAILVLFANFVSGLSIWALLRASMSMGAHVQRRIFNSYMDNDYSFFALNNSSKLTSQITQEIPRMIYMVVQPILHIVSQFFICFLIVVALLIVDIVVALVAVGLVLIIYFIIFKIIRGKVVDHGEKIYDINRMKLKLLNESLGGIKEVKLRGNEDYYKNELNDLTVRSLSSAAYIVLAGDLPRFVVETIIFSAILGLSIFIIVTAGSTASALSIVSLYAMAGYKLLPAVQTIYKSYSSIKANGMVVSKLAEDLERSELYKKSLYELGNEPISVDSISFNNVYYHYPNSEEFALSDCSFEIKKCEITAFVGTSGAGKSTCVDLLLGLLTPTKGDISVKNCALSRSNLRSWRSQIGYVAQDIFLLDGSFRSNIAFGEIEECVDEEMLIRAAKMANIHDFIMSCEGGYDFEVGERGAKLSGGQKQRIGIARALYKDPKVIIFDEATSALDNITEHNILNDIQKLASSKTIVMVAHRLTTVENANNIILFDKGRVLDEGTYSELAEKSEPFAKLLSAGSKTVAQ